MPESYRAAALCRYLAGFAALRTSPVRDVRKYQQVIWADELLSLPGITWHHSSLGDVPTVQRLDGMDDTVGEEWLTLRRLKRGIPAPPAPPQITAGWYDVHKLQDPLGPKPSLTEAVYGPDGEPLERLTDRPDLSAAWDAYLTHWLGWADRHAETRQSSNAYRNVYRAYKDQSTSGEQWEVVLGFGLLQWNPPNGPKVRRHLVTVGVAIGLDNLGTLTVIRSPRSRAVLEQDMLDPADKADERIIDQITQALGDDDLTNRVDDPERFGEWANQWLNRVNPTGEYRPQTEPTKTGPDEPEHPIIDYAPALILRKRTPRDFEVAFSAAARNFQSGGSEVNPGLRHFIDTLRDGTAGAGANICGGWDSHLTDHGGRPSAEPPARVYFPLPANDEQRQILTQLKRQTGVLVQGPPGTGKSHTIVNLICHALASGQKVLVTSHKPRPLQVLKTMIGKHAESVSPLCVWMLGSDRDAMTGMEDSVRGITERYAQWEAPASEKRIETIEGELHESNQRLARLTSELRNIRERETRQHRVFGYQGSIAGIASALRAEEPPLDVLPDPLHSHEDEPPVNGAEFGDLAAMRNDAQLDEWETQGYAPVPVAGLGTPERFAEMLQKLAAAEHAAERMRHCQNRPEFEALTGMNPAALRHLIGTLTDLRETLTQMEGTSEFPWMPKALEASTSDNGDMEWRLRSDETDALLQSLEGNATSNRTTLTLAEWMQRMTGRIYMPPALAKTEQRVLVETRQAAEHLESGGSWGFAWARPEAAEAALRVKKLVRVEGAKPKTSELLRALERYLKCRNRGRALAELWAPEDARVRVWASAACEDGLWGDYASHLRRMQIALRTVDDYGEQVAAAKQALNQTGYGQHEPVWHDRLSLASWIETAEAAEARQTAAAAHKPVEAALGAVTVAVRGCAAPPDPAHADLLTAIRSRDPVAYRSAWDAISGNADIPERLLRRRELDRRLSETAPRLAQNLRDRPQDGQWERLAQNWDQVWNRHRVVLWVKAQSDDSRASDTRRELEECQRRIRRQTGELASEKAWSFCFNQMTDQAVVSLKAWRKAIKALGRGTGRHAARHRRDAQQYLDDCQTAVSAWVMPLYQVVRTFTPGESPQFDVAIIDEASQSGPEALLLALLAKQLVVVGDDQQIHPEYAGIRHNDVSELQKQHLPDMHYASRLGTNDSFFDLADIIYRSRIRLREHFRCMPEIIGFSNNLCYESEPLIPLRQYGTDRLQPIVQAVHVDSGYQRGKTPNVLNLPEAEAIVEKILELIRQPEYESKTIGVISLLGHSQSKEIERRLLDEVGAEIMKQHDIVCGEAYTFQGDERDVILLSMVSSTTGKDGQDIHQTPLTKGADYRRFNVAASRARDQMFLYHSVTTGDIGNPDCVRRKLIDYCQRPHDPQTDDPDVPDLRHLEQQAKIKERHGRKPPAPFDSWFEVDVYLMITRRGYKTVPQREAYGYRIDMVIEGSEGNLAVECDGEHWHGPDRYEHDLARQAALERCGWRFWRLRESRFRHDPDEAMAGLWETLEELRIHPVGASAAA